jgi:hypothetical protein
METATPSSANEPVVMKASRSAPGASRAIAAAARGPCSAKSARSARSATL